MIRILLFSLFFVASLWAHKINLFAYDENGILYIQSYFTKSSPCKACSIKLLDKDEQVISSLLSNDEGKVAVSLPKELSFIVVEAGMGHQARIVYQGTSDSSPSQESSIISKKHPKGPPTENIFGKITLSLAIIALFFGGIYRYKKR